MEFKIVDTGTGIAADHLSDIFERFHPVDSSDTRAHSSVGLGLYTVQKYAALLKGTIQGESRAGKGSTFTLRIPREPKKSPFVHEQLSFPSDPEDSSGGAG